MSRIAILPACIMVSLFLGGCVAGEGKDLAPSSGRATASAETTGEELGGSIQGFVRSEELMPVAGAKVGLVGDTPLEVTTDEEGKFGFLNLAVGDYTVVANKLGYESRAIKVKVVQGQAAWTNLTLVALAIADEPYTDTTSHVTQLECMLTTAAWVSSCSYPYTAVFFSARDHGVNLSQYGAPPDIMENKWRYNFSVEPSALTIVSEMQWTAVSEAAKLMRLRMCEPVYDAVFDDCPQYEAGSGPSPISFAWEPGKDVFDGDHAGWIMSCVWPDFPGATSTAQGVYLSQKVEMWNTEFYNAEAPEGWTVFANTG